MVHKTHFTARVSYAIICLALLAALFSACYPIPQETLAYNPTKAPVGAAPAAIGQQLLGTDPSTQVSVPSTPATTADTLNAACLIGAWSMTDLQQAVGASYSRSQSPLQLQSVEGETRYAFDETGNMQITFNNLIATLNGTIEGKEILARNLMFGTATAQYRLNVATHEIIFSNFGGDGIQFATEINGQVLAQGNFPAWRAFSANLSGSSPTLPTAGPTHVVDEAFATVACAGDEMRLQAIDPVPGPEVRLRRVDN